MTQTSVNQLFLVVSHYNKGKSVNFISKSMKSPRTTTNNIKQQFNKDPTTLEKWLKPGRPQKLDTFEQKLIIRKSLAQPKLNYTPLFEKCLGRNIDRVVHKTEELFPSTQTEKKSAKIWWSTR